MKNKYDMILLVGSRIKGAPKFGSVAEQLHHELHVIELTRELGSSLLAYHKSLGFMTVELTDEEYNKYKLDHRIYSIEQHQDVTTRNTQFTSRDTLVNNQWHLKQLSNRLFNPFALLCGFKMELAYHIYGYPELHDSISIAHNIVITSAQNKFIRDFKSYNYELELKYHTEDGRPCGPVQEVLSTNSSYPIGVDIYLGYDVLTDSLVLSTDLVDTFTPLYTVKIKLYNDPITLYYGGVPTGLLGFTDLKLIPETADVYLSTVQGEGVDVVVGDCQLNVYAEDIAGRASIYFNAYYQRYIDNYGAWDTNTPLIDQHGTACAHAAGGTVSGLANKVNIVGITCLDISEDRGNQSDKMLYGLDAIVEYIAEKKAEVYPKPYPIVVNLSIGSSVPVQAYDDAIAAMIVEGATVCIAAGNDDTPAANSPYDPDAIFVAASNEDLTPCSFTNYGPRIDVYSPGSDVYSTMQGTYNRWAGTSVASPNVAGLCALFLSLYPETSPAEVKAAILNVSQEVITYNKDATTYRFVQNPCYGFIDRSDIKTAPLLEHLIYTVVPYFIGYDGERIYGSMRELTLNSITSAIVSAGKSESIELATCLKLVP